MWTGHRFLKSFKLKVTLNTQKFFIWDGLIEVIVIVAGGYGLFLLHIEFCY